MRVSPDAHAAYIAQADTRAARKLCGTARILKYWRACRAPLSLFHIEMLLAQEDIYDGRSRHPLVFNWIHRKFRPEGQETMQEMAVRLVKQARQQ